MAIRRWGGISAAFLTALLLLSACGYSKAVYPVDYLNAAGVKSDTAYSLVAAPELTTTPKGTFYSEGSTFLTVGSYISNGEFTVVESARFAVNVQDERTGTTQTAIVDLPLSQISWVQTANAAPTVQFTLKYGAEYLYEIKDSEESIWTYNEYNYTKNAAVDTYSQAPATLFKQFTSRAVITVTPEVFQAQVLPLQTGKK